MEPHSIVGRCKLPTDMNLHQRPVACPHFLGIGAQRSATSWLNEQLSQHPDIWLPPLKELHYFDAITADGSKPARRWHKDLPRLFRKVRKLQALPTKWDVRFLFGRETDAWYQSLFTDAAAAGYMTGEITPAYAVLDRSLIERIHSMNPDMKIIFLMRDPIDRSWSNVVKSLCRDRGRTLQEVPDEKKYERLEQEIQIKKSTYSKTIEVWESVFPATQIFYGFFEDVCSNPAALLDSIFKFIGVDGPAFLPSDYNKVHNAAARGIAIPEKFERHLAALHLQETAVLAERFGEPAASWHRRCQGLSQALGAT
jgi:hypothetical protein